MYRSDKNCETFPWFKLEYFLIWRSIVPPNKNGAQFKPNNNEWNSLTTSLGFSLSILSQGRIQSSSSYANDEVVFPSYEMLNMLKTLRVVLIQSNNLCIIPGRLWSAKFPVISPVKLLFWSMSFEGDCRSIKVFRVEFLTLNHPIWEHLPKFFLKS